jgi:cytochrome c553
MSARDPTGLALGAALLLAVQPLFAQDLDAGRAKAQACAVCHGQNGISGTPDAPHLAGQPVIYLKAQLRAYRSGARAHEVMTLMARPLSDDDITNLAAWYAAIRIEATLPR